VNLRVGESVNQGLLLCKQNITRITALNVTVTASQFDNLIDTTDNTIAKIILMMGS